VNVLWVVAGAAIGAPLRYLTDRTIQTRHSALFPWGTFTVNMVASMILGLIAGAVAAGVASYHLQLLIGTGLCATLSTYSTFSYETVRLAELDATHLAVINVALSVSLGIGAAFAGVGIADALWT
jgi:CrcB protein